MAQSKVSDFFRTRKKTTDFNPSKRRKLQPASEFDIATEVFTQNSSTPPVSSRTRRKIAPELQRSDVEPTESESKFKLEIEPTLTISNKTTRQKASSTRSRKKKAEEPGKNLQNIKKAFEKSSSSEKDTTDSSSTSCDSIATSSCDNHCVSPPSSPNKRSTRQNANLAIKSGKRSKHETTCQKELLKDEVYKTPEKCPGFSVLPDESKAVSTRKKLVLKKSSPTSEKVFEFKGSELDIREGSPKLLPEKQSTATENTDQSVKETTSTPPPVTRIVDKIKEASTDNSKKSEKVTVESMKEKLAKCGKLSELKAKLSKFEEAKASLVAKEKTKKVTEAQKESPKETKQVRSVQSAVCVDREKQAPAYERFHSLASPVPPSLSLPYKYKVLAETFQCSDTVVSMLHKRSEVCTFSKLQAAVQQMRKKAFELRHLGQIVTVYPEAYTLRQEIGLPQYGKGRSSTYQLTVEANLADMKEGKVDVKKKGEKPQFTAALLLLRKDLFHRSLISLVKSHHKIFLSKLSKPLTVPDDKITRWHPQFPLDNVPDINPASLPEAPDVKKYTSAEEVLQSANISKLNPKIQQALKIVANQKAAEKMEKSPKLPSNSTNNSTVNKALQGVPESLLQRVRAREQEKLAASMTRTVQDDKRRNMMSRLPDLTRILRTIFVTEKKPALLLDDVVQRLSDSYKSCLGNMEAEKHLMLITEVLPDWLTVVTVKKGRYLKLDKNKDMSIINKHVQKLINEHK